MTLDSLPVCVSRVEPRVPSPRSLSPVVERTGYKVPNQGVSDYDEDDDPAPRGRTKDFVSRNHWTGPHRTIQSGLWRVPAGTGSREARRESKRPTSYSFCEGRRFSCKFPE